MSKSKHKTDSSNTAASVRDLATDANKCISWLASRDGRTNIAKTLNVFLEAIYAGRSDICQLILENGHLNIARNEPVLIKAIETACLNGHLSLVQLIVSRCCPSTKHLRTALKTASEFGRDKIMIWLLSVMKPSRDDCVKWLLTTASAHGDINKVRVFALQAGVTSTEAISQALGAACYQNKVEVVKWLTKHTTADASFRSQPAFETGSMTSLATACFSGNTDIVVTLLPCVTPHTINMQCGTHSNSALHYAICYNNFKGWNHSLHGACYRANIDEVTSAVYDADVNTTDNNDSTPLHYACKKKLREHSKDVSGSVC